MSNLGPLLDDSVSLYPALANVIPTVRDAIGNRAAQWVNTKPGDVVVSQDSPCQGFPFVVTGAVRVMRESGVGRQLELYCVEPGQLCLTSCACLFQSISLAGKGFTASETRILLVTPTVFDDWMQNQSFRQFVMGSFAERILELSSLVDAMVFTVSMHAWRLYSWGTVASFTRLTKRSPTN